MSDEKSTWKKAWGKVTDFFRPADEEADQDQSIPPKNESPPDWTRGRNLSAGIPPGENPVYKPPPEPPRPPITAAEQHARRRWKQHMPAVLLDHYEQLVSNVDTADYNRMRADLLEEYGHNPDRMALDLFYWHGGGGDDWRDYRPHETVPEQLLFELPLPALVEALSSHPLDEAHLTGAARFFSGDIFVGMRGHEVEQIPADLVAGMRDHLQEHGTPDQLKMFTAVFGRASGETASAQKKPPK